MAGCATIGVMYLTGSYERGGNGIPGATAGNRIMTARTAIGYRSGVGQLTGGVAIGSGAGNIAALVVVVNTAGGGEIIGAGTRAMAGQAGYGAPRICRRRTVGQSRITIDAVKGIANLFTVPIR